MFRSRRHALAAFGLLVSAWLAPHAASAFEILGQVTDAAGNPFSRARVELAETRLGYEQGLRWIEGRHLPEPVSTTVTDEYGAYRLEVPEPGLWRVTVSAPGHIPMERGPEAFVVDEQLPPVALVADAGLTVTVTNPEGNPLPGARVWFGRSDDSRELWRHAYQGRWRPLYHPEIADGRGQAHLPRLSGEILNLRAWAPGYLESPIAESNGQSVRFELSPGVMRRVAVRDARGEPVEGVLVRRGQNGWTAGVTDENGRATVALSTAGESLVRLDAGDGRRAAAAVQPVLPQESEEIALPALPESRSVRGRVSDLDTGDPVAGALVWYGADGRFVRTGPRGAYELPFSGAEGELSVRSVAPGYSLARAELVVQERESPTADLALKPAFQIRGRVVDAEGRPLAGASIWWRTVNPWNESWLPYQTNRRTVHAGHDGSFVLGFLTHGREWELRAEHEGYAPTEVRITAEETSEIVVLMLDAGHRVVGRVVGPERGAISGAELRLFDTSPERQRFLSLQSLEHRTPDHTAVTAEDGRFEVSHLPEGSFALVADAPGYAPRLWTGVTVVAGRDVVDQGDLTMEPGVTVQGRVVDSARAPVAAAEVMLAQGGYGGWNLLQDDVRRSGIRSVQTDEEGVFRFEDLTPGETHSIVARKDGMGPAVVNEVRASSTDSDLLELVLHPGSSIFGEVVGPRGRPLEGVDIRLIHEETKGGSSRRTSLGSVKTGDGGGFRFDDLPPGHFLVEAPLPQAARPATGEPLDLVAGEEVGPVRLVREAEAKLEGRVLTAQGRPAVDARVAGRVSHEDPPGSSHSRSFGTQTDGAGRFALEGFPTGRIRISAEHPEHGRAERTLELAAGLHEVELLLRDTARIEGRVVDAETEAPVSGAHVWLHPDRPDPDPHRVVESVTTDAEGRFLLRPAKPGTYRLTTRASGYLETSLPDSLEVFDRSVDQVLVRLDSGATITGRVTGLEPAELGRVTVLARPAQGGRMLETDVTSEGHYRLRGIDPDVWNVLARLEDPMRQVQESTTVEEGQREAIVNLDFEGGYSLTGRILYNGEPSVGMQVVLSPLEGERQYLDQLTDHRGGFRFGSLEAGRYRLNVILGQGLREVRTVDLVTDEEIELSLEGGSVVGRVIDENGQPVTGGQVALHAVEAAQGFVPSSGISVRTDPDGRFEIDAVGEGTYRLIARAASVGTATQTVTLNPPHSNLGDVTLERGTEVLLAIHGPAGTPVQALVGGIVRDAAGQPLTSVEARVGDDGLARVSGVPSEAREMFIGVDGYVPVRVPLGEAPGPHPVTLVPAARMHVRVPALTQGGDARVHLVNAAGRRPILVDMIPGSGSGIPLYQGQGGLPALTPGLWTVTVTAADGRTWTREVAAVAGETVEVVLE